ncbi:MAG: glycosyltransferase [Pseudomonadota bacterium]|nr:glycosyltransferase [Pseudomonadota bacterium]
MLILVYSDTHAGNVEAQLGKPEYSYYYVLREYLPVLRRIGIVVVVHDPEQEVDRLWANARDHGQDCVFLSFSPPHKTCLTLRCPTIPVLAWEYSSIPVETWFGQPHQDWRTGLAACGMAITHSQYARQAILDAMGPEYPVISAPAPVWDRCSALHASPATQAFTLSIQGTVLDSRTLDLAPFDMREQGLPENRLLRNKDEARINPTPLTLDGILYLAIFNPEDDRKNWADLLDGFVAAHRHRTDTTLIVKLVHMGRSWILRDVLRFLYFLQPYACRIVLIHGYLDDAAYEALQRNVHYVATTTRAEGQCLPLMELMSMGKPALAPRHSSLSDYVNADNTFLIDSHPEPTFWAHDPRRAIRALRFRIHWPSVQQAFEDSYQVAKHDTARYAAMSEAAMLTLRGHCSQQVVHDRVSALVERCMAAQAPTPCAQTQPSAPGWRTRLGHWLLQDHPQHDGDAGKATLNDTSHAPWLPELTRLVPRLPAVVAADASTETSSAPIAGTAKPRPANTQPASSNEHLWCDTASGMVCPGFSITPDDVLVEITDTAQAVAAFAQRQGANVRAINRQALQDRQVAPTGATATRVVWLEADGMDALAPALLAGLATLGKPGAQYLLQLDTIDMDEAAAEPTSTNLADQLRAALAPHGLHLDSVRPAGFYLALRRKFLRALPSSTTAGQPALLEQWTTTWELLQQKDRGPLLIEGLHALPMGSWLALAHKNELARTGEAA